MLLLKTFHYRLKVLSEAHFLSTIFYPNQAENGILDSRKTFLTPFIADFLNAPAKMRSQGFLFLCFGFGAKKSAVKPAIIGAKNKLFKIFKNYVQQLAKQGDCFVGYRLLAGTESEHTICRLT